MTACFFPGISPTANERHYHKHPDESEREYVVTPYQMEVKEGKYYLICNYNKYDDISNYRLDRIRELKILDKPAKPFETLRGAKRQRLNLTEYMKEHIYMFSSETVRVKFCITKPMIRDVIETFGKDIIFSNENIHNVTVTAHTNEMAMEHFAKVYAPDVINCNRKN